MSWLYRIGINHRNRAFDAGKGVQTLDRPVISVGNLSTGGTGKTPVVHQLIRMLQASGHRPVIAMRGYGAKPGQKGDEQREHELALPGVPVVAQPDRLAGLQALFATDAGHAVGRAIDCVVLDDGFQHRQIARDLDIVLVDASRLPHHDALLPKGHLREPIASLDRAGLIVLTHAERLDPASIDALRSRLLAVSGTASVLIARHIWTGGLVHHRTQEGWQSTRIETEAFKDQSVHLICGIGNAEAFEAMARSSGVAVHRFTKLRDHEAVSKSRLNGLFRGSDVSANGSVMMTQKDWVKASRIDGWPDGASVIVPQLSIEFDDSAQLKSAIGSVFRPFESQSLPPSAPENIARSD